MTGQRKLSGIVLITGAAGGIGRACAEAFSGVEKLLVDKGEDSLAAIAEPQDEILCGDLSDEATVDRIVERVHAAGGLAAGVHAAAISPTMGDAAAILTLNYGSSYRLAERLCGLAKPGACLVLIASLAGHRAQDESLAIRLQAAHDSDALRTLAEGVGSTTAYALAKFGVIRLAERASMAWGQRRARIVSLSPGVIDTPMHAAEAKASDAIEQLLAMAPIGRLGRPQEIAAAARFLCSGEASFITGCDLKVDGGAVAAIHQSRRPVQPSSY